MPIATAFACTMCGAEFESEGAEQKAAECETLGEPDFQYEVGQVIVVQLYSPGKRDQIREIPITITARRPRREEHAVPGSKGRVYMPVHAAAYDYTYTTRHGRTAENWCGEKMLAAYNAGPVSIMRAQFFH